MVLIQKPNNTLPQQVFENKINNRILDKRVDELTEKVDNFEGGEQTQIVNITILEVNNG